MDASSYDKLPHITAADLSESGDDELMALLENASASERWHVLYETNPELAINVLHNAYEATRDHPEMQEKVIGAFIKTLKILNHALAHEPSEAKTQPPDAA